MILQALTSYFYRTEADSNSASVPVGFQRKDIPFIIVLDRQGRFKGLQDTREGEGKYKRARTFTVPREVKRSGTKAWMSANLLWDNEAYVLGFCQDDPEMGQKKRKNFISRIQEVSPDASIDEGINAVIKWLESSDTRPVFSHPLWAEIEKKGGNFSFQLEGDTMLVCQREAVVSAIAAKESGREGKQQTCLVSGVPDEPVRLHTAIKGVWGTQTSGANIVSFNLPAFNSYGKTQGYNAPIGKKAEFAYTTALDVVLSKDSRQRIQLGDANAGF